MIISGSFWRKTIVTLVAAFGFVSLYEVTALDSKYAARQATRHETSARPIPGERLAFSATAYCKGMVTTSGVAAQRGVAAADPEVLPVGSVVDIDSIGASHNGIYTVMDTGPSVQGRQVDLHVELQRGAHLRTPPDSPDGHASRLESWRDHAELLGSFPQAHGGAAALSSAPSSDTRPADAN